MKKIDQLLNSITMYRLVLYGLLLNLIISFFLSAADLLTWDLLPLLASAITLITFCHLFNFLLSKIFRASACSESDFITALILFFILIPVTEISDFYNLILASALAMGSKYIFAIHKKHLFNPAAISLVILSLLKIGAAFWWVATPWLFPTTLILGLLIVRKIRRSQLFLSFLIPATFLTILNQLIAGESFLNAIQLTFTSWPLIFFGTIMLTEPLTTPPRQFQQIIYGIFVGIFFGLQFQLGPVHSSPELALVLGNLLAYLLQPRPKIILKLKEKIEIAPAVYEFIFQPDSKIDFLPGQYLEWTIPNIKADSRGNRRYFTIASSPTEENIKLGVRVAEKNSSSFKNSLLHLKKGQTITVSDLAGDFILEKNPRQKLVFIAGGIGITPFRSMIQYLVDKNLQRNVILFYCSISPAGFAFKEVFENAQKKIGLETHYLVTDPDKNWKGLTGYITPELIKSKVADFKDRIFYLSGPNAMVENYKIMLIKLGVKSSQIRTDYFPGF